MNGLCRTAEYTKQHLDIVIDMNGEDKFAQAMICFPVAKNLSINRLGFSENPNHI